jgi:hypothetical protein
MVAIVARQPETDAAIGGTQKMSTAMSTTYTVVARARARSTGATVELIDNRDGAFEDGGLAWVTFCDTHGNYCEHETRQLADSFRAAPEQWCGSCQSIYYGETAPPPWSAV